MAAHHPLFTSVYSSQPPGFLLLLLPGHLALGGTIAGERLTALVLAMAGLGAVYRTASVLGEGRPAGRLAAAALAADFMFTRQSVALQADGPSVALALLAVALAAGARRPGGPARDLLAAGAGALLAVAVLTKLLALAAAPAVGLLLLLPATGTRPGARALALALAGGAAAAAALLLPFAGAWPELWRQVVGLHLGARSLSAGGLDDQTRWRELPLAVLGLGGLAAALRRAPALGLAAGAWAGSAALLLALQHPLWPHHLVALSAPLALLAGGLATVAPAGLAAARLPAPAAAAGLLVAATAWAAGSAVAVRDGQRPDATLTPEVQALRATTAPGELVVTDDQFAAAAAGRDTPPELVDTSFVRVTSGDLTPGALAAETDRPDVRAVLLATGRLSALPGFRDLVAARFPRVQDLGGGGVLYRR